MTVAASGGLLLRHLHRCLASGPAEAPPSPARRPNQAKVAPPMRMIPAAPAYMWTILRISFSPRFYLYTQEQPEARPLPPPPTPGSGGGTCKMFCCFPTMGSKSK